MPFTVAGQWRILTAFPSIPRTCFTSVARLPRLRTEVKLEKFLPLEFDEQLHLAGGRRGVADDSRGFDAQDALGQREVRPVQQIGHFHASAKMRRFKMQCV